MRRYVPRVADDLEVEAAYADLATRRGPGRPYVFVNMVASADGAYAVEGRTKALSSAADRYVFHYLRSLADVILVGAQTVRAEGYGPPKIPEVRQAEREARGQAPVPRIAIVTSSLDLDWSSALFTASPTRPFILTTDNAEPALVQRAREVAHVVVTPGPRVDLAGALAMLGEQGVGTVLCEGGPTLNGVLGAADLIDELCLTIVPALAGGDAGAGLLGHVRLPGGLLEMETVHLFEGDGDLFLRYRRTEAKRDVEAPREGEVLEPAEGPTLEAFNDVMADVDFPMCIVTASDGRDRAGCLVGFAAQCSIDPPRYAVWISKKNRTYRVARSADVLAVHFPSADQRTLAELFGGTTGDEVDKFAWVSWTEGAHGEVLLEDIPRVVVGRVTETIDGGDHVAFLLAPIAGRAGDWSGQLGFQAVKDIDPGHEA